MSAMEIENETAVVGEKEGDRTVENSEKEEGMFLEGFSLKEKRENDERDSKEEPRQKKSKLGDEETKEGVLLEAAVLNVGDEGAAGSSSKDMEINLLKTQIEMMEGKIERMRTETDDEDGEEAAKKAVLGSSSPDVSPMKTPKKAEVGGLGVTPKKDTPRRAGSIPAETAATPPRRALATPTKAATTTPRRVVATPTNAATTPRRVDTPRVNVATKKRGGSPPAKALKEKGLRDGNKAQVKVPETPRRKSGSSSS